MATTVYYARLTIPAGTPAPAPVEQVLPCRPGRLSLVRLYVPPGPRGEVSVWLLHQRSQIAPVPPATWDNLDDDIMEYPLGLELAINEADISLGGGSPNANFEHAIDFECQVEATAPGFAPSALSELPGRILAIFGQ